MRILGRVAWPPWRRENGGAAVRDADADPIPDVAKEVASLFLGQPPDTPRSCLIESAGGHTVSVNRLE